MHEYDFDYKDRVRGPGLPIYRVHNGGGLPLSWIVVALVLFLLFGGAGLGSRLLKEAVENAPKECVSEE